VSSSYPARADRLRAFVLAAALFCVTLVTFAPVVHCGFVNYDDPQYIYKNPRVRGGLTWAHVGHAFAHADAGNYQPLTFVSLMLDRTLWGESPVGFHATNLVLHGLNAALVFLVLRAMTGATWRSAIVALLFALHPLRVESVAWATERKDVQSMFFGLLTIALYVRHASRPGVGSLMLVALALMLSLLSKATFVTLPVLLLLLDVWPLRRCAVTAKDRLIPTDYPRRPLRALVCEKLPLLALSLVACMATMLAQRGGDALGSLDRYRMSDRIGNALLAYARYLGKIAWPTDLAVFYPHREPAVWPATLAGLGLLALTGLAVSFWRRTPAVTIGWLWFLGTLVPMIGLIQSGGQSMADRFTYLPMIGLLVAVIWAMPKEWLDAAGRRALAATAVGVVAIVLAASTRAQIGYWTDSISLFEHAIAVTRDNHVAHNNLAFEYARLGNLNAAKLHYAEALRIKPNYSVARNGYGALLANAGDRKGAIEQYELAVTANPNYSLAHRNLATQYLKAGWSTQAMSHLRRCLQLNPGDALAHHLLGVELAKRNDLAAAMPHFGQAVASDPGYADARMNLARALIEVGQPRDAMSHLDEVLRVQPGLAEAHFHAGVALARLGNLEQAAEQFRVAVRLDPTDAGARDALDQVLAAVARRSADAHD
jgi:tetratricopeptide (TPR) repeat protein